MEFDQNDYQERHFGIAETAVLAASGLAFFMANEIGSGRILGRISHSVANLGKLSPRSLLRHAMQEAAGLDRNFISKR